METKSTLFNTALKGRAKLFGLMYLFSYKMDVYFSKATPKNLDPSKMDLDFWDCFGREKLKLQQNYTGRSTLDISKLNFPNY